MALAQGTLHRHHPCHTCRAEELGRRGDTAVHLSETVHGALVAGDSCQQLLQLGRRWLTRAIERGQALSSADSEAVSQVFPALAFHRGAALGLPVDEEFVVRVVDNLLMPLLSPDRTS